MEFASNIHLAVGINSPSNIYAHFIVYNLVFTFIAAYFLLMYRETSIPYLFWIKVVGFGALGLGSYQTRRSRLYFYHNLGLSLKKLVFYSFVIDTTIAVILFCLIYAYT